MYLSIISALVLAYCYYTMSRTIYLEGSARTVQTSVAATKANQLTWPKTTQSAVGVHGSPILETHGRQTPLPIASVAKVITALTVLEKYPLNKGDQGPIVTLTESDVALYDSYSAQEGSVMPVRVGEKISEYQMLQAIMLPSANNIADSMAIWAYGSLTSYATAANDYLARHGLDSTHVGTDASGMSPTSVSTAKDLTKLGELAMNNRVLSEIVSQPTASNIPVAGTIKNVNFLLGESGIVGVKTGNSDQAGGVFVGASKKIINTKPVTIVTAVLGSDSLFTAMKDSLSLTISAQNNFHETVIANQAAPLGGYLLPWGGTARVIASKDLFLQTWNNDPPNSVLLLRRISSDTRRGQTVGSVTVSKSGINNQKSVPVTLESPIPEPSIRWRLTHPF